ncbi:MAG: 4Fe-4S binding protein [Coriobacteriales bacterium]|nr:4Fe-4S binding protein [Coriobacteriales bacterium]
MAQKAFFYDMTRCTGCKTCVFACKDKNDLDLGKKFRTVYEIAGGETTRDESGVINTTCISYYISIACAHCDNPACVTACPTGAMQKEKETGIVRNNPETCIGCGACVEACPYGAPIIDADLGIARKCDGCRDYIEAGMTPVCVAACPALALRFGDVEEMSALGERISVAPLPDAEVTGPNIYVKPCRDAQPAGSDAVAVINPLEIELGWYEPFKDLV